MSAFKDKPLDAVILDVDGVLTRTDAQHERAWRTVLEPLFAARGANCPFTREEYLGKVDGKPRRAGLESILSARGINLSDDELESLSARKNREFNRLIEREGVRVFDDARRAVRRWRAGGLGVAFVSASRNAREVLRRAGLIEACDVLVDGETAKELGLSGKLELFREAARRLDAEAPNVMVVEDAIAGVEAAAQGGFGWVLGLSRNGEPSELGARGASQVVSTLDALGEILRPDTRRPQELPSALPVESLVRYLGCRRPALLLDFDGTLTPIVSRPDDAVLDDAMRTLLAQLSARCRMAIISGRDLQDVMRRVGLEGLWYAGSHGFELRGPKGQTFSAMSLVPAQEALDAVEASLRRELSGLSGVLVERKRFGVTVHYRMASIPDSERALASVRRLEGPSLDAHVSERAIELRPAVPWDKGRAVRKLLELWELDETVELPIYLGDGRTDEDAFRALLGHGLTVLVGAPLRPTCAERRLEGPEAVRTFLEALLSRLDRAEEHGAWTLRFEGWRPERERLREALCTLGNGYFATRGAAEESRADRIHYPGTYFAGGYDRMSTELRGEVVEVEDLVNWPNWIPLTFRPEGGEWLSLEHSNVLDYVEELYLHCGELVRRVRFSDRDGRETRLTSRRFVSMTDPHVAGLEWEMVPLNWSGQVTVRSGLDGGVENAGVERYAVLRGQHLVPECVGHDGRILWLAARSRQSRILVAQAARTHLVGVDEASVLTSVEAHEDRVELISALEVRQGVPLQVEKLVTLYTSRDHAISEPLMAARARLEGLSGLGALREAHELAWASLWRRYDIQLGAAQAETNRLLRLHMFHLLQVASPHVIDRDVAIPARGLHGEAYRGHIFWDELFIFPFLNYSIPELTRELLMYRYRRLDSARGRARALGREGAAYPWQSGSDGREESARMHLNPLSSRWLPDETHLQRHVNAAIAWNIWEYHQVTGDLEFLAYYGAEMLVEIARFFASLAEWDEALGRYRIRGVVGPDEFHTRRPGAKSPGVDDNAYTNVMAAWCLRTAERALLELSEERRRELLGQLGVDEGARYRWKIIAEKLRVVFSGGHIISQFDGYAELRELDWDAYRARYKEIQRLDRILEAEGDDVNAYQASKQADVLMLFFLFSAEELVALLASMGYAFEPSWISENVEYYLARTSHGSSLSRVVHSWVLARSDRGRSFGLFKEALCGETSEPEAGTTSEGIHLGAMASTVDLVKRGYTGAVVREGVFYLAPRLPDELDELRTRFRVRGAWLDVHMTHAEVTVRFVEGAPAQARVGIDGTIYELQRGDALRRPRAGR